MLIAPHAGDGSSNQHAPDPLPQSRSRFLLLTYSAGGLIAQHHCRPAARCSKPKTCPGTARLRFSLRAHAKAGLNSPDRLRPVSNASLIELKVE